MIARLALFFILCKRSEGCYLVPYLCPAGRWTCGWGSTGIDVIPGQAWAQEYADRRLEQDAVKFALGAISACPCLAWETDARLSAVTDWAYNLGLAALRGSTMRKRINAGLWESAARECRRWIHAAGRVLKGLVIRREAEALWLEGEQDEEETVGAGRVSKPIP